MVQYNLKSRKGLRFGIVIAGLDLLDAIGRIHQIGQQEEAHSERGGKAREPMRETSGARRWHGLIHAAPPSEGGDGWFSNRDRLREPDTLCRAGVYPPPLTPRRCPPAADQSRTSRYGGA